MIQILDGRIAYEKQDSDGAVRHLREAIRLRAINLQARYSMAQAYRSLGQPETAASEAQQAERVQEENPRAEEDHLDIEALPWKRSVTGDMLNPLIASC
jgi:Flp pilus assembly protein TadD